MSYSDYLASRGYRRVTIERTSKAPGHVILHHVNKPVETVPRSQKVVAIGRKAVSNG